MEKELSKILKLIDEEPEKFIEKIPETEKKLFREISVLIKELRLTPGGNIEPSIENLEIVNSLKSKIAKIAASKEYANLVNKFVSGFPTIANYQTGFANVPKDTKKLISATARQTIDDTLESLIGAGYKQEVVNKLNGVLLTSVVSGGSYADLTEQLRGMLVSTGERPGLISKYAKTFATDALAQFDGQATKMVADSGDYEWFAYLVSNITTTREFCEHLTKKHYFHKSEIPELLTGMVDGHQCKIYDKTGLPQGMIEGTDPDNFFVYRGGYRCRHRISPIPENAVPLAIRERMKKKIIRAEEYGQLKKDTNYTDVNFNPENGGLSAIHKKHNFSNEKGVFGVPRGDYERLALKALYKNGDKVILESEAGEQGVKMPDGYLNGKLMDIKGIESNGETSIRNSLMSAKKQKVETCVLYFHNPSMFSEEKVLDGWKRFNETVNTMGYVKDKNIYIQEIKCIVNGRVINIPVK